MSASASFACSVAFMAEPSASLSDWIASFAAERWLDRPEATGEGVTVALLDSGVDVARLHERHPRCDLRNRVLFAGNSADPVPAPDYHSLPHGTTVADILLTLAPGLALHSADVFGPRGTCEVETIVQALRYAIEHWQPRIVNLSLGVPESKLVPPHRKQLLQRTIDEAYDRGVLVVASANNDHPHTVSYPAVLAAPLLSVDKHSGSDPREFAYRPHDRIEFEAHGRGYSGVLAREPATSWAAPHLSAYAARLLSMHPQLRPFEIKTLLAWLGRRGAT